jgi:tetratricopeptide (TPR) repeat protein
MIFKNALIIISCLIWTISCTQKVGLNESGKNFEYKPDSIIIGKSTKAQVIQTYGQPIRSNAAGKYEKLIYGYTLTSTEQESMAGKMASSYGTTALGLIPGVGAIASAGAAIGEAAHSSSQMAQPKKFNEDFKTLVVSVGLADGIVKDYTYRDSLLNGEDQSATLQIKASKLQSEGKTQESIALLEQAISLNPKNYRAYNNLAWMLADLNIDNDKALNYAQTAVEIFPDCPYSNGTLGTCYYKKKDYVNADKYLTTSINLFPVYAPQDQQSLMNNRTRLELVKQESK